MTGTIIVGQMVAYKWAYNQPPLQSRDAIIVSLLPFYVSPIQSCPVCDLPCHLCSRVVVSPPPNPLANPNPIANIVN